MLAFGTPLEPLVLNHLLTHWFAIQMGDWSHATVRFDALWILRFITTILAFPILAVAILALSFLLVVSRSVPRLLGWSRELS